MVSSGGYCRAAVIGIDFVIDRLFAGTSIFAVNDRDRTRLINLLARTTSPYDGEALVAVRKANELLRSFKLGWADVIGEGDTAPTPEPQTPPERADTYGRDIFGDRKAWTPSVPPRVVRAGCIRLLMSRIPWPLRIALAPLSASAYLAAWALEGTDLIETASRAAAAFVGTSGLLGVYLYIIVALIHGGGFS